jgi:hypothetical protein
MASLPSGPGPTSQPASHLPARRGVGMALTAYGAIGLVLLGAAAILVGGLLDGGRGPLGLEAERRQLADVLDATGRSLGDAETAARDADTSLAATATAAGSGARFTSDLGTSLRNLAASLRVSILGSQPFAGPAGDFDRVAVQAAGVAADLDAAAASIRLGAEDMHRLAGDLGDMRTEVIRVRDGMKDLLQLAGWRLAATAILVWLAVPAVVSLVVGLRWWHPRRRAGGG